MTATAMTEMTKRTPRVIWMAVLSTLVIAIGNAVNQGRPVTCIAVPRGKPVLVDGKLGPGEWGDARRVVASDSVAIYLKHDARYLYVAVQPAAAAFSVDLYFDRDRGTRVLDLHASAKLGEREGSFGQWPEWVCWNNRGWAANVARVATFEPREFLADQVKEFQIDMRRLSGQRVWLSFEVQAGQETSSVPVEGAERYGRRWLALQL